MSWQLSWSDEFNGAALNSSWSVRTNQSHCCGPFGGPGELQLYLPDEVSVHDGHLDIRTRRHLALPAAEAEGQGGGGRRARREQQETQHFLREQETQLAAFCAKLR